MELVWVLATGLFMFGAILSIFCRGMLHLVFVSISIVAGGFFVGLFLIGSDPSGGMVGLVIPIVAPVGLPALGYLTGSVGKLLLRKLRPKLDKS